MLTRYLFVLAAGLGLAWAQAPTAPVIGARGVTNLFTQDPAPGSVAQGGLVQITGLNLGPVEGATASDVPWPTKLADVQVVIGGKPAALYSVAPGKIVAQVAADANTGLVDVVVRRASGNSAPAKVTVTAVQPAVRTASGSGFGTPWGTVTASTISTTADGLGPVDDSGVLKADLTAYVGGLPAAVSATASSVRPGEFDVNLTVPSGARAGDLITLLANRQAANRTVYQPDPTATPAPGVEFVPLPGGAPAIASLTDAGTNGNFLLATGARGQDGCYAGATVDLAAQTIAPLSDCLTNVNAALAPAVAPAEGATIAALVGPPQGDAQSGISSTVKIFGAGMAPLTVALPSPAAVLTANATGLVATLPGTPPQVANIDPVTGAVQLTNAAPGGATGGAAGGGTLTVNINGLTNVYASANLGQNRIAVIAGDDPLKPAKAAFAIMSATGDVLAAKDFPAGWLPLLNALQPARQGSTAAPAPPREPALFDNATRLFYVLARAADASKDGFIGFPIGVNDPKVAPFPDGWFAASCTADIRLLSLDLVGQVAVAGAQVAEAEYQASCPGSGFLTLDLAKSSVAAIPLPDQGPLRVPSTRADTSLNQMNNYVFGAKLDTTRNGTSDTLYVLDGVNGNAFVLASPGTVNGFTDGSVQQIPAINALVAQTIDKTAGDQGLVLFSLDLQTVTNLFVPDGFATVATLDEGATVCCLATRKLVGRALKQGGANVVIYDLGSGDITVVPNPDAVSHFGPPPAAGQAGGGAPAATAGRLIAANARANTVYAATYSGNRQNGIMVVRIP